MAYEYRMPRDEFFGVLSAGCTALDTSLQATVFASNPGLPAMSGTSQYVPLVLADDTVPTYEVVYISGHASSSTTVTVLRGQEGTTARQWPTGTTIRCAPTVRDGIQSLSDAGITALTNAHTGMSVVSSDSGRLREKTKSQGWLSPVGVAKALTTRNLGMTPTADMVPVLFPAFIAGTTQSGPGVGTVISFPSGYVYVDVGTALPNNVIISVLTSKVVGGSGATFHRADFAGYESTTGNLRIWFVCVDGGGAVLGNGIACNISMLLVGA